MALVKLEASADSLVLPATAPKEMISVGRCDDGRPYVKINSSSLSILQECPRKAYYSLYRGFRSNVESPATLFGRAIHGALELYYSSPIGERNDPILDEMELISYGHSPKNPNSLTNLCAAKFCEIAQPLSPLPAEDKRSLQNGVWILSEYFKTYRDDPYVALVDDRGLFVERPFVTTLVNEEIKIDLFGTIDFAFHDTRTGQVIVGDHKTSSSLSFGDSSYFDRERPNHQYSAYAYAAKYVFGIKNDDFMVNIIEVKSRPKTARGKGVSFPRQITKRGADDFLELARTVKYFSKQYLEWIKTDNWPQGGVEACNRFGGCSFKQVCAAPFIMQKTILEGKFNAIAQ